MTKLRIAFLLLAATGITACASDGSDDDASTVVASLNGREITVGQVDDRIMRDLFERESQSRDPSRLHELRTLALDRIADDMVVEAAAKRRGVTTEELIELEVGELGPVGQEEIVAFYEENRDRIPGNRSLEDVAEMIRSHLQSERANDVVARLREDADFEIYLQPPRREVAAIGPAVGPEDAPITIVEFSDFQCPYCSRAEPVVKEVLERYPEQVRLVYRHLPLGSHQYARGAAEASVCAEAQGRFWEYHEILFANQRALSESDLSSYAEQIGLDSGTFETCLAQEATARRVDDDLAAARAAGARGTPAFFVNGVLLGGAVPFDQFAKIIDAELERIAAR